LTRSKFLEPRNTARLVITRAWRIDGIVKPQRHFNRIIGPDCDRSIIVRLKAGDNMMPVVIVAVCLLVMIG
jgi:hypothetical protein